MENGGVQYTYHTHTHGSRCPKTLRAAETSSLLQNVATGVNLSPPVLLHLAVVKAAFFEETVSFCIGKDMGMTVRTTEKLMVKKMSKSPATYVLNWNWNVFFNASMLYFEPWPCTWECVEFPKHCQNDSRLNRSWASNDDQDHDCCAATCKKAAGLIHCCFWTLSFN